MADELDVAALTAEVSGDLFPGGTGDESGPNPGVTGEEEAPIQSSPQAEGKASLNPTEAPPERRPLPKSWKKDMSPHWDTLPDEVREYVYSREADVMRGLQQYQNGYNQWNALTKPYQQLLQKYPDVNPVNLMQNLMNSHLQLMTLPPDERKVFAKKMMDAYQIKLEAEQEAAEGGNPLKDELNSLRHELSQLKSGFTAQQRAAYNAQLAQQQKTVESFFSAKENEFAEELGSDILRLIKTGAAQDLPSAYEMACWSNPAVRAKMIAKQQSKPAEGQANGGNAAKFPNVDSTPGVRVRTKPKTMEETIDEVVAKYQH